MRRSLEEDGTFDEIGPRIVETLEFVDPDVEPGMTYYCQILPVDADERVVDAPSATVAAISAPKPPTCTDS